ncbi:MAG: carotenoid biosynthesis protein, partial [Deltaproteobacteria bacterium]|nr:carotenoid biosynthesis protein [Deltaproteobacteria bacterium]
LPKTRKIWLILAGSTLTMMLDVIIDPVAKLGKQWFLGEIYYYAHPGEYFGIPITNFLGWFLVPLVVILFNIFIWKHIDTQRTAPNGQHSLLNPLFYSSIALFNIGVAFYIGAILLGVASSVILVMIMTIVTQTRKRIIRRALP